MMYDRFLFFLYRERASGHYNLVNQNSIKRTMYVIHVINVTRNQTSIQKKIKPF